MDICCLEALFIIIKYNLQQMGEIILFYLSHCYCAAAMCGHTFVFGIILKHINSHRGSGKVTSDICLLN